MDSIGVTVSERGTIVLPVKIRKELNIESGSKILITLDGDRLILQPVGSFTKKLSGITKNCIGTTPEAVEQFIDQQRANR
jgi:AbrB family looped-hinge helix DNA binding protein